MPGQMNMISKNAIELGIKLTQDIDILTNKPFGLTINMGGEK
jgi:hypothetical protein